MKQGNMLENLVMNIYFIKIIDNNMKIDNNRNMSYYRIDYEFYICNHILYENYVSLSV